MNGFFRKYWPSLLVFAAVCWLTLSPEPTGKVHIELFEGADKVVHACMMGGLTAIILFDLWRRDKHMPSKLEMLWVAISMVVFSALDEWAQGAMGMGRTSDPYDLLADIIGIILALLATPSLLHLMQNHNRNKVTH